MPNTVSVIMPAHGEVGNLEGAVRYVTKNFQNHYNIDDWEIIIVDSVEPGGSTDGTPATADKIIENNSHARVIHNKKYVNLGFKYRQGLKAARFEYFMMVPGKNTLHGHSLKNFLDNVGLADIVVGYQASMGRRPFYRRAISKSFTFFMNAAFGLKLKYYNGTTLIPTKLLKKINPDTENFAYMAEILVILIKKYHVTYIEVPFYTRGRREYGKTQALKWNNIKSVAGTVTRLIKNIYWSDR